MLSDDGVAERLAKTTSAEELRSLLMGEQQSAEFQFDVSLIALDVAADSLMTLQALNAGRLQRPARSTRSSSAMPSPASR